MAKGDALGSMPCPCCGGAWVASESKTGGISFTCANGFQGLAKYPRTVASLRARLTDENSSKPKGDTAPAPAARAPAAPSKARDTFAEFMGSASK